MVPLLACNKEAGGILVSGPRSQGLTFVKQRCSSWSIAASARHMCKNWNRA